MWKITLQNQKCFHRLLVTPLPTLLEADLGSLVDVLIYALIRALRVVSADVLVSHWRKR